MADSPDYFRATIVGAPDRVRGFGRVRAAAMCAGLLFVTPAAISQVATPPAAAPAADTTTVGVNLNITPKRLTFDRADRSASVYVFNQGTTAASFDVSLVERVMLPSGDIRSLAEVNADPALKPVADKLKSAQTLLVATPRRVTLAPGKGQTIRIRATQPVADGAAPTEYRSHLTVATIPPRDVGLTAEDVANQKPNQLSFRVRSVFGLSIPVIVRTGTVDVTAGIQNARLDYQNISPDGVAPARRTPVLSFDLTRSGANSLFGNVEVRAAKSRDKGPLGLARGVGVYTEIDRRLIRVPLQRAPSAGEQLEIAFIDDDAKPGSVIARSTLTAP